MEKRTRTMLPAMARQQRTQRKILYIIQTDKSRVNPEKTRRDYSKEPYFLMASSIVISPLPTLKAATRIWTVSGSLTPRTSGEKVRSAGTLPKGA